MSLLEARYPEIEEARAQVETRIKHLEDKLFSRKNISEQINQQELQCNIINLYNMMKETADNQTILHQELNQLKNEYRVDHAIEARIHSLEHTRRQAESRAKILQHQIDQYNIKEDRNNLYAYHGLNKKFNDIQMNAKIQLYKASLEKDSKMLYENRLLKNIVSQEELQLERLRRDREAFQRSYKNLSLRDNLGSSTSANFQRTNNFSGSYYGRHFGGQKLDNPYYEPNTTSKSGFNYSRYHPDYQKQLSGNTQSSPGNLKSPYNDLKHQDIGQSDTKNYYDKIYNPQHSYSGHFRSPYYIEKDNKQDKNSEARDTIDKEDLNQTAEKKLKPNVTFNQKKIEDNKSDSDSLQNRGSSKQIHKQLKRRSNSLDKSSPKKSSLKRSPQKSINVVLSDKYLNVNSKEKSPSKKRKDAYNANQIRKDVFERIQNRIVNAWAVYQDSTFRNTKHEKDHLFNTYALETRLRAQIRQKLECHPIVQRKFGLIVD